MRLRSGIWIQAYIWKCSSHGLPVTVARRGDDVAGAIYIKVNLLDGNVRLYGPALPSLDSEQTDRRWSPCLGPDAVAEPEADAYLSRQAEFDGDIWVLEVEDRHGRHLLDEWLTGN
ncbi:MAG: DUF1491 family protein [Hyphomicrobiaceae bacterium]|nr:DUF1491 family protein [Hyphomicrobiaceae bacterium]